MRISLSLKGLFWQAPALLAVSTPYIKMCAVPLVICCSTAGEKEKEELPSVPCTVMCRQLGLGGLDALIRRQLAPPCVCRLSQPWARHDGRVLTPVNCLCMLLCVNTCMCHPAGLRQCLTAICSGAFVPRHPPPPGPPSLRTVLNTPWCTLVQTGDADQGSSSALVLAQCVCFGLAWCKCAGSL